MRSLPATRYRTITPLVVQGQRVIDLQRQLARLIATRTGTPALGWLLAQPRLLEARDEILWDTPAPGPIVALADTEANARARGEQRFDAAFTAVREVIAALRATGEEHRVTDAALLEAALAHPTESDRYLVGEVPVLVNWGCQAARTAPAPAAPAVTARALPVADPSERPPAEMPTRHETLQRIASKQVREPRVAGTNRRWGLAAWGPFLVLWIAEALAVHRLAQSPPGRIATLRLEVGRQHTQLLRLAAAVSAKTAACPRPASTVTPAAASVSPFGNAP